MDTAPFLQVIDDADITAREYRAARKMLDRVSDQGSIYLEQDEACTLFGVTSWGDVRRILHGLKSAGVIAFHTNRRAYVTFCRAESAQPRAEKAQPRADSAQNEQPERLKNRAESAQPRAEKAQPRADSARAYRLTNTGRQANKESLPEPERGVGETSEPQPINEAERQRSMGLLMEPEIGLDATLATQLAGEYQFEQIRRQVFRFLRDRKAGTVKSAGVLRSRLARNFAATINETDRASPLWAKYGDPPAEDSAGNQPGKYDSFVIQ